MALFTVAFLGSTPIGGPIVGWIGQSFGARWSLALGGIATLLAATAAWRSLSGLQRKYPDGPAAPVELEVAEVP